MVRTAARRALCRWMPALGARLALALVVGGCATTAPPLPADFTPQQARIVAGSAPPEAVVEGPASKVGGMFRGAAWGGGIGLLIGAVEVAGCTGFLCGLAIYGDTLLGTLVGAGVGALVADHEAEVDANRAMLAAALVRRPWSAQLAESLRDGQAADGADARRWTVTVSFAGVDALSHLQDHAFALRLRAR